MQIIIHRGTHQIGGVATEIRTNTTRILIDIGDELSLDENFNPAPLSIPGVTDTNGNCDAVLFTHNHGDHIGQLRNVRDEISLYMGNFARDVLLATISSLDKGKQKTNNIIGCQPYTKHRFQQNRSGVFVCVLDIVELLTKWSC